MMGNWHLFGDGSNRILRFDLPGVAPVWFQWVCFSGKMPMFEASNGDSKISVIP